MAISYSLMIMFEVLLLVPIFSLLLLQKRTSPLSMDKRKLMLVTTLLIAGSIILFLAPKVNLISDFSYTKLTVDAWDHYTVTNNWSEVGAIQTDVYPYYSKFPITYVPQIMLHQISGLSLFDSMTIFYLLAGAAGLLIINGIAKEVVKGPKSERLIFGGISCVVYSFLQYFNLLFVQQYPIAFGLVVGLFCMYSFIILAKKRNRSVIYLCVAGIMLSLSHPLAPIMMSMFFLVYFIANKARFLGQNPYRSLISRRISIFLTAALIMAGFTYSSFVALGTFEKGIEWSGRNVSYTFEKLSTQLFESTVTGVAQSFESRYETLDLLIYPLNWALPASTSLSILFLCLSKRFKVGDEQLHLLLPMAIMSTFLFALTFAFSFVEFAFSRYFGAFALAFNIPLTAYIILRMIKSRVMLIRYSVLAIMALAVISSVTDPTILPNIRDGSTIYRSADLYPTKLDLVAWSDFYSLVGVQQRVIQTNLHAGPIDNYRYEHDYKNVVAMNVKNFTLSSDNTYLILNEDKLEPTTQFHDNPLLDRVYDNSKIFIGR